MRILLTTTSFIDTPGMHQKKLHDSKFKIDELRGPLKEEVLLPIISNYDGIICGDDDITYKVISLLNYDCTYFDESIFTVEEYFNRKNNKFHPRSWTMNVIKDIVEDKYKPASLNKNTFYSDFEGKFKIKKFF